jgi:hypothetical protein
MRERDVAWKLNMGHSIKEHRGKFVFTFEYSLAIPRKNAGTTDRQERK